MTGDLRSEALRLANQGQLVVPLHSIRDDGSCTCGKHSCPSPGKHPRTPRGLLDGSSDPATITAWWSRWPTANIGVVTGRGGRVPLLVVDVDGAEGEASCKALQRRHGALPATRWVLTGSGGWHAYFRAPEGPLGNSAGKLGPGLDTRCDNGYVICPPSRHASGGIYSWHNAIPAAPAPAWLVSLLRPPAPAPRAPLRLVRGGDAYVDAALRSECEAVAATAKGGRNHRLNAAAYSLGSLVGAGRLDESVAAAAVLDAGLACGLGQVEVERTVRSGLRAGQAHPREVVA